jgi:hypothetical protein
MVFLALSKIVGLSVVLSCVTGHDTQYQDDHVRDTAHAVLSSSRELSPNQNVSEDRWFFSALAVQSSCAVKDLRDKGLIASDGASKCWVKWDRQDCWGY